MRIALANPTYWPEVRRGTERVMHDLAVELRAGGHAPRILTTYRGSLPYMCVEDGVEVMRLPRPPGVVARRRRLQEHVEHMPLLRAALACSRPELVHSFHLTDAAAGARYARRAGVPAVFSFMGIPRREWVASVRMRLALLERAVGESDAVIALSRAARDELWRWLGVEARIVHPGVELDAFPLQEGRDPVETICCASASEDPRKRVALLVAAFALVRRERPRARLLLMRPRFGGLGESLAGEPGIEWLDLSSEQVVEMYGRAWVCALPSYDEAFGLVLVEALACGRPVVACGDGGAPEIVDGPAIGRLFDGEDPAALARALLEALELADNPGTAPACRRRAQAFSAAATARAHEALYAELCGARGIRVPARRAV